jgi:hypothetical protein
VGGLKKSIAVRRREWGVFLISCVFCGALSLYIELAAGDKRGGKNQRLPL